METSLRNAHVSEEELCFLIINYLSERSEFSAGVALLAEQMHANGALGKTFNYRGEARHARIEDKRGLYAKTAPDHLKRLLEASGSVSGSLLEAIPHQIEPEQETDGREVSEHV